MNRLRAILFFSLLILPAAVFCQTTPPKTVRDYFYLLPPKYFTLEGCAPATDKNCNRARREYIENFLETEDTANGFWKSGCDGAQSCLTLVLFKRPAGNYVVALKTEFEMGSTNYFLEYKNGRWLDLGAQVIPNFSPNNIYELPQNGTTIEVFAKNKTSEDSEKGKKLYNLVWKNGKFSVKR